MVVRLGQNCTELDPELGLSLERQQTLVHRGRDAQVLDSLLDTEHALLELAQPLVAESHVLERKKRVVQILRI